MFFRVRCWSLLFSLTSLQTFFRVKKMSMTPARARLRVRLRRHAYIPPDEEIDVTTSPPDEERSVTPTASAQSAVPAEQAISPPPMQPQPKVQSSQNHRSCDSRNIVSGFSPCTTSRAANTATTDAARGGGTIKSFLLFFIIVENPLIGGSTCCPSRATVTTDAARSGVQ